MNDKKKKKFIIPEAEVIPFSNEDIITESAGVDGWNFDDNVEVWG